MKSTSARVNLARQNLIRIKRWVNATATRAHRLRAFTPWLDDAIDMLHELAARKAQEEKDVAA